MVKSVKSTTKNSEIDNTREGKGRTAGSLNEMKLREPYIIQS